MSLALPGRSLRAAAPPDARGPRRRRRRRRRQPDPRPVDDDDRHPGHAGHRRPDRAPGARPAARSCASRRRRCATPRTSARSARELLRRGVRVPLVADIHFTPNAALIAAEHVEKVRINPGNFADKKKFEVREYDDAAWRGGDRARRRALPPAGAPLQGARPRAAHRHQPRLALRPHPEPLRRHAARHGRDRARVPRRLRGRGLPRRRLQHEGEQPAGGDPGLSAARRAARGARAPGAPGYPFHVGVTEAGDGEDGRIKSAIGIGALLEDGIGDTIRVSLTEDPVKEVPVARALARALRGALEPAPRGIASRARVAGRRRSSPTPFAHAPPRHERGAAHRARRHRARRRARRCASSSSSARRPAEPEAAARALAAALARGRELACEGLLARRRGAGDAARAPQRLRRGARGRRRDGAARARACRRGAARRGDGRRVALRSARSLPDAVAARRLRRARAAQRGVALEWRSRAPLAALPGALAAALARVGRRGIAAPPRLACEASAAGARRCASLAARLRRARARRAADRARATAAIRSSPSETRAARTPRPISARCSATASATLVLRSAASARRRRALALAYRILQGARLRTTWTEFISCPSCGRTLFDLEETTARIKARTAAPARRSRSP